MIPAFLVSSKLLRRRSTYCFQMLFLQRALKKRGNKWTACSKKKTKKKGREKKGGIVVWCVVNKVILQNSSGSLETSRRHLAELKANIDVVLGKWGSLRRLFSPPLCLECSFFFTIHIIWLMVLLFLVFFLFFFYPIVFPALPRRCRASRDTPGKLWQVKYFC